MAFKKVVRGDNNNAAELGSHNRVNVILDTNGAGVVTLVWFFILSIIAIVAFLWFFFHVLLLILFLSVIVGFVAFLCVFGASVLIRHISETKMHVKVNAEQEKWAGKVYVTDSVVASIEGVLIHNGRDIQEIRHFDNKPAAAIVDASVDQEMAPSLPSSIFQ